MRLRQLFTDDDAVSPVIGVILMVAITVILAAVIGAFVLGFGDSTSSAPSASFDTSANDSDVVFTHEGGDPIPDTGDTLQCGGDAGGSVSGAPSDEMTAGDTAVCSYSDSGTVSLNYEGDDTSTTLASTEV